MEKVALFVDVQNVYYTTKQAFGRHFDYNAFWALATRGRQVEKALAYAIDRGDGKQRQFQNILRGIGFDVQLKPYIQRSDGSSKGDWDVGIAIDVMDYAANVDVVVLVSGDGDYALLVDRIRQKHGLQVEVYGVEALTAQGLVRSASAFFPIGGELLLSSSRA